MGSSAPTATFSKFVFDPLHDQWLVSFHGPDNILQTIPLIVLIRYWHSRYFDQFGAIPYTQLTFDEDATIHILRAAFVQLGSNYLPERIISNRVPNPTHLYGVTELKRFFNQQTGHRVYLIGDSHMPGLEEDCSEPHAMSGADFVLRNLYASRRTKVSLILEADMVRPLDSDIRNMLKYQHGLGELHVKLLPCFWPGILRLPCHFPHLRTSAVDARVGFFNTTERPGREADAILRFILKLHDLMENITGAYDDFNMDNVLCLTKHYRDAVQCLELFQQTIEPICDRESNSCFVPLFMEAFKNHSLFSARYSELETNLQLEAFKYHSIFAAPSELESNLQLKNHYFRTILNNASNFFASKLQTTVGYFNNSIALLKDFVNAINTHSRSAAMDLDVCNEEWYTSLVDEFGDSTQKTIKMASTVMDYVVIMELIFDAIETTPSIVYAGNSHNNSYELFLMQNGYVRTGSVEAHIDPNSGTWCMNLPETLQTLDLSPPAAPPSRAR